MQSSPENQLGDNKLMSEIQEEHQNSQDENDVDVRIVKKIKYSAMDSAKYGISEGITETTSSGE